MEKNCFKFKEFSFPVHSFHTSVILLCFFLFQESPDGGGGIIWEWGFYLDFYNKLQHIRKTTINWDQAFIRRHTVSGSISEKL